MLSMAKVMLYTGKTRTQEGVSPEGDNANPLDLTVFAKRNHLPAEVKLDLAANSVNAAPAEDQTTSVCSLCHGPVSGSLHALCVAPGDTTVGIRVCRARNAAEHPAAVALAAAGPHVKQKPPLASNANTCIHV